MFNAIFKDKTISFVKFVNTRIPRFNVKHTLLERALGFKISKWN